MGYTGWEYNQWFHVFSWENILGLKYLFIYTQIDTDIYTCT